MGHVGKKQVKPKIIFFGDSHAEALPAFNQISERLGVAGIVMATQLFTFFGSGVIKERSR